MLQVKLRELIQTYVDAFRPYCYKRANSLRALHTRTHIQVNYAPNQRARKWTDDPACTISVGYLNACLTERTPYALDKRLVEQSTLAIVPFWLRKLVSFQAHKRLTTLFPTKHNKVNNAAPLAFRRQSRSYTQ